MTTCQASGIRQDSATSLISSLAYTGYPLFLFQPLSDLIHCRHYGAFQLDPLCNVSYKAAFQAP